jgi:HEAT repeat protein
LEEQFMLRFLPVVLAMIALSGTVRSMAADMPSDVAAQVAKFKDADPKVRQQAMSALAKMGEKAKPAMPKVLEMVEDKNTWVMTKSLMAITEIGPDETAIKPVLPFLGRDPDIRTFAVDVFVKLGEKGVPALTEALKDDVLAIGACEALTQIGPKGKPAAANLTAVSTKHASKPVRDAALKALKAVNK